jgi:hypothetical protein
MGAGRCGNVVQPAKQINKIVETEIPRCNSNISHDR